MSQRLTALEADLCKVGSSDPVTFASTILNAYTQNPHLKQHSAYHRHVSIILSHLFLLLVFDKNASFCWLFLIFFLVSLRSLDVIDRCFSRRTMEEIISALEREATQKPDEWISATIRDLKKASPASLKISLRSVSSSKCVTYNNGIELTLCMKFQIREGRFQGVGKCLIREYRMVCHVLKREISKDFVEGCRAVVIDKDRNPKWEPRSLEEMKDNMVERYFEKVDEEDQWKDLKLSPRKNLPALIIAKL
ncbi:unnamed protein product [Brassica oleracea var. botrytis]|uniref:3-hydroxyisobutyryl-CoA hydrolase n=1 Tax=Brassica napus TaxID=3708 RepID=A0A816JEJ8_BRANA|nr:unnamed protein product [Brassica napus]